MISPEEFKAAMQKIADEGRANRDVEMRHSDADELLCAVLASLGYADGVDIYNRMNKWYA